MLHALSIFITKKNSHRQRFGVRHVDSGAYAGADLNPGSNALSASESSAVDEPNANEYVADVISENEL